MACRFAPGSSETAAEDDATPGSPDMATEEEAMPAMPVTRPGTRPRIPPSTPPGTPPSTPPVPITPPHTPDTVTEEGAERGLGAASYAVYSALLFTAYWFGASRFDPEQDEEFDPEDVQAYLDDPSVLQRNMLRSVSVRSVSKDSAAEGTRPARSPSKESGAQPGCMTRSASKESGAEPGGMTRSASKESGAQAGGMTRSISKDSGAGGRALRGASKESMQRSASKDLLPAIEEDGVLDEVDFTSASSARSFVPDPAYRVWRLMQSSVSGAAEEDLIVTNIKTGQVLPLFVLLELAACALLWIVMAALESSRSSSDFVSTSGGLDSIWVGETDLRATGPRCRDCRHEVWRWFTYQFTHVGVTHILTNAVVLVGLGVPLEGMHGHIRMLVMFNAGVVGGALCSLVADPHGFTVGCSGGAMALLGIHFADLFLNWRSKKFRYPTLALLLALVAASVSLDVAVQSERTNHAGHVGGAVAGLLIGAVIGRSMKARRHHKARCHHKVVVRAAWLVGVAALVGCIAWYFAQASPRSVFEAIAGEGGWCWYAQMLDTSLSPLAYRCVRCSTPGCVDFWHAFNATESPKLDRLPALHTVSLETCQGLGWYYDER